MKKITKNYQKMQNKFSYSHSKEYMLRICDQTSTVQQPLEKNDDCIEMPALVITNVILTSSGSLNNGRKISLGNTIFTKVYSFDHI